MGQKRQRKKRPCRICRKWFLPNPRLDDRQKTCGAPECQRQWHVRKCAEWNLKNRACSKESYLRGRIESLGTGTSLSSLPPPALPTPQYASPLDYPRRVVQEVIGMKQLVIIEYIVRLLLRGVQEVIKPQPIETRRESRRLPCAAIARGDSQRPPPQGMLCADK